MKPLRIVCVLFTAVLLSDCKVQITVPEGGRVETKSGAYVCESGETCVIDVVDVFFDEVFKAKPAEGFKFTAWRKKNASFCGGSNRPCPLTTTLFPGTPLMPLLESDHVFFLEPVFGRPNTWIGKAPMPTSRVFFESCVIRGKIYVIGGQRIGGGDAINSVEMYDPATDSWTTKASLPEPRMGFAASAIKNKCYIFGGTAGFSTDVSDSVLEYDPAKDIWRYRRSMPTGRVGCSSAVVNGKAFVFGGWSAVSLTAPVYGVVEEFDPGKNSWRMRASMPTARAGLSAIAVNELIYVIGGANQAIGAYGYSNVERYDPSSNEWQTVADIPTGRFGLDTGIVAGKIYAFGGIGSRFNQIYPNVEQYNPATDTWRSRAALAEAQWGMTSNVVDGQVYVIGGSTESGIGHNSLIANRQFTP